MAYASQGDYLAEGPTMLETMNRNPAHRRNNTSSTNWILKMDYSGYLTISEGTCFKLNETSFFILSNIDGKNSYIRNPRRFLSTYPDENPEKCPRILKKFSSI
jgi:hypothetical protein